MTLTQFIIDAAKHLDLEPAMEAYQSGNNHGEGQAVDDVDMDGLALVWAARTTDDLSVYGDADRLVLVGTDGSGDDSRWAVVLS